MYGRFRSEHFPYMLHCEPTGASRSTTFGTEWCEPFRTALVFRNRFAPQLYGPSGEPDVQHLAHYGAGRLREPRCYPQILVRPVTTGPDGPAAYALSAPKPSNDAMVTVPGCQQGVIAASSLHIPSCEQVSAGMPRRYGCRVRPPVRRTTTAHRLVKPNAEIVVEVNHGGYRQHGGRRRIETA